MSEKKLTAKNAKNAKNAKILKGFLSDLRALSGSNIL